MSVQLELNCLVLGDDPTRIFTIDIEDAKKVSTLKELIKDKNKPTFDHVPAHSLNIYHVSFSVDHGLNTKLKGFRPKEERDRLLSNSVKRLKGVFGHPVDEHLHVIIERPDTGKRQSILVVGSS
jgi:hypothetical protein